jgi:hypothetical protein
LMMLMALSTTFPSVTSAIDEVAQAPAAADVEKTPTFSERLDNTKAMVTDARAAKQEAKSQGKSTAKAVTRSLLKSTKKAFNRNKKDIKKAAKKAKKMAEKATLL